MKPTNFKRRMKKKRETALANLLKKKGPDRVRSEEQRAKEIETLKARIAP